ncbi:MAG TPA: hypothetical protein VJ828_05035, partial [Lacipirellulaceae bacterium]|nr:hypothetical protein [Lacipirellulaceae bacterium]
KSLGTTADKTIKKECDKKKHKDVIAVLEKYAGLIKSESSRLEDLKLKTAKSAAAEANGEEEDEEDEGKLFEPDYLHKMLKLLRSTGKELNFGFGLNTKDPAASKLLLTRKGQPERLMKALKKTGDFSNRLIAYGTAIPDPQDGKTLVFKLSESAGEPPQIQKLGRQFLRSDKNLKFRKLRLILPGGQVLEDTEPDTEEEKGAAQATAGGQAAGTGAAGEAATEVQENLRKEFKEARKRWVAIRKKADQDIEIVKDGVRDHYLTDPVQFPIAMKKLKELDEIMDNLNDDLRDALDAYVSTPLKQQDRLREMATNARQLLDNFTKYVNDSALLTAIDQKEFADVQIKAPMMAAMRDLARTIK